MDRMLASEFVEAVTSGRFGDVEGRTVAGEVSLRGRHFEGPLLIRHVTFEGEVDLADVFIEGELDLKGCTFTKTLALARAEIEGNITLDDVVVMDMIPFVSRSIKLPAPFDLQGVIVHGDLRLVRAEITSAAIGSGPTADLRGIRARGSVLLDGFQSHLPIDMSDARIDGNLSFGIDTVTGDAPVMLDGGLIAASIQVDGNVVFAGSQINSGASFASSRLGNLIAYSHQTSVPLADGSAALRCFFGGNLDVSFSQIRGYVSLAGVTVTGVMTITASQIGAIGCHPLVVARDGQQAVIFCRFGSLVAPHARVRSWADFLLIQVDGLGDLTDDRAIHMVGFEASGDVRFWTSSSLNYEGAPLTGALSACQAGATVAGDVAFNGCKIGGMLSLTNLRAEGMIVLNDAEVGGDVVFSTAESLRQDPQVEIFVRSNAFGALRGAAAHRLDMTGLSCRNDVDLTGLRIIDPAVPAASTDKKQGEDAKEGFLETLRRSYAESKAAELHQQRHAANMTPRALTRGTVSLRGATVKGEVRLFRAGEGGSPDTFTWIDHAIDLSTLTADKVILSAYSFDEEEAGPDDVPLIGINLANANIRELEIPAIRSTDPASPRSAFPVPIDLGDSRISVWNVTDPALSRRKAFTSLLRQDKRFRRSTYLALESYFRNQGHDDDANAIYREMSVLAHGQRWHDLMRRRSAIVVAPVQLIGTIFLYLPFRWLLGFGTQPLRLLALIAALWLASLPIYRNPVNFEPSIAERAARAGNPPNTEALDQPKPGTWSWSEALAVSVRFHVPLGGLAPARSSWDLRDNGATCWGPIRNNAGIAPDTPPSELSKRFTEVFGTEPARPCAGLRFESIAPEDWGMAMSILNLIMWPLVLTFGIRKLLRQI